MTQGKREYTGFLAMNNAGTLYFSNISSAALSSIDLRKSVTHSKMNPYREK